MFQTLIRELYDRSPVWVQNVMTSVYGGRLRLFRYGGKQPAYQEELEKSQWLSLSEMGALQLGKLRDLLRHSCRHVEFYRERAARCGFDPAAVGSIDDLTSFPTLSRDDVLQNAERMVADNVSRADLVKNFTSGTSGSPLSFYLTRETWRRNYAFWARFRNWFGFEIGQRRATFGGRIIVPHSQKKPPFWRYNIVDRQLLFSSFHQSRENHSVYVDKLIGFKPHLIDGYVSSIYSLARFINREGIGGVRPRAVQTTSETLLKPQREEIEKAFCCKVFDQYGHGENAVFISECEAGGLHVNDEYGVVEILVGDRRAEPGETGEIVVTGFNNPAMPLIRYHTSDMAVAAGRAEGCSCGRGLSLVKGVQGRVIDVLRLPDGRLIPPTSLTLLFDKQHALGIEEAQIVQTEPDQIVVRLVLYDKDGRHDTAPLERDLRRIVGDRVRLRFDAVDSIERTALGKFRFVVSEIEK